MVVACRLLWRVPLPNQQPLTINLRRRVFFRPGSLYGPVRVMDAHHYSKDELLRDGASIRVRAIRPDDKPRLIKHFESLSARSVQFRFFGAKRRLTDAELQRFTEPDFVHHVALVATLLGGDGERIIGVGRYFQLEPAAGQPRRAEVAFAVLDEFHGRGIGTLLLEHLGRIARDAGIEEFAADVLGENNRMLEVFAQSGWKVARSIDSGVVHVTFPTAETEEYRRASQSREMAAAARSIEPILNPRSVALVGASRRAGSIGATLLQNLRNTFTGSIYPVNPNTDSVDGLRCHASVGAIGAPVDLAVIAVPAAAVEEAVADCARSGVRGVVVISAGFGEVSAAGRAAEQRLRQIARHSGMRMVGPNCMGVLNTDAAVQLNATFAPGFPPAGNVSMLSQSGALGLAILDYVQTLGVGIATFLSAGNKVDVSSNDLLAYWSQDERTRVIVLYLESFGNPRRFARIAPEVGRAKPIVAVKSGRSAAGTRAASSHSAALASLDVAAGALFEQAGVIRTDTLEEMFGVVALLSNQPLPAGRRVGAITNAGGPGILLADACEAKGLELPTLAPETVDKLRSFLPPQAGLSNPVDMIASATPEHYTRTIAAVGADPNVDALVIIHVPVLRRGAEETAAAIAAGAETVPPEKPVLNVFLSSRQPPAALRGCARGALPSYTFPENAAMALAAAERYSRWRARPRGSILELDGFAENAIRAVIDRVLSATTEPCWLSHKDLDLVLRAAGIEYAASEQVPPAAAQATAEQLGYPLVMKAVAPGIVHKSDLGGVILGLDSPEAVARAVGDITARMRANGVDLKEVLLQREVAEGIEALVGVTTDPTFGPLVVCGLGGVLVELLRDVSFRLTPVSDIDAAEMLDRLRSSRLLDGYRGAPPSDRAALTAIIQRVSALVEVVPEITELDLNPVKVLAPGKGAVVVDARMRVSRPGAAASKGSA
jgi:acetyl coenzyme A synthetase (ADP forming)-like protein